MVYIISYDLNQPGQKYDALHKLIKDVSNDRWAHILESTYIIHSLQSAEQIHNRLNPALDKSDRIFVSEISKNYSGYLEEEFGPYIDKLF